MSLMDRLAHAFDFKKTLYTKFRQVEPQAAEEPKPADAARPATIDFETVPYMVERRFREGLDVGSEVDFLKQDTARGLQMWTIGKITAIKDRAGFDISSLGATYLKDDDGNLKAKYFVIKCLKDVTARN